MEWLVEGECEQKHTIHATGRFHFGIVPFVERLIEGFCQVKHLGHILHIGHVPIIERLVIKKSRAGHSDSDYSWYQGAWSGWLKEVASSNIPYIFHTLDTFQLVSHSDSDFFHTPKRCSSPLALWPPSKNASLGPRVPMSTFSKPSEPMLPRNCRRH